MFLDILKNPLYIIAFLTVVTLLVAAHELGHYLFARVFRMEVEEFAIGFGKKKWVWKRKVFEIPSPDGGVDEHETEFTVRPFPVGGFVRIAGMQPEVDGSEVLVRNGFYSKQPWQRFIVLFAGPVFSLLAGIGILIPLYMAVGVNRAETVPVIGGISVNQGAYSAGLRAGDRFVSLDGKPINTFFDVLTYVRDRPEVPIQVVYERKGKQSETTMIPVKDKAPTTVRNDRMEPTGESRIQGKVGISPGMTFVRVSPGEAVIEAINLPLKMIDNLFGIFRNPARFQDDVGGPMTMLAATAGAVDSGMHRVIELAGLLSISLAIFNLLPVPPLDGGQMVIAVAEMFRRGKRLSMRVQEIFIGAGTIAVLTLVLGVVFVDIKRFFGSPEKPQPVKVQPTKSN